MDRGPSAKGQTMAGSASMMVAEAGTGAASRTLLFQDAKHKPTEPVCRWYPRTGAKKNELMIISGGQSGVDQAAHKAAIELKIDHDGWCPSGRLCETGRIPPEYQLQESDSTDCSVRTKKNIEDSDATLIIRRNSTEETPDGTELTERYARYKDKHPLTIYLDDNQNSNIKKIIDWIKEYNITTLNIGGPRESNSRGINALCFNFLKEAFAAVLEKDFTSKDKVSCSHHEASASAADASECSCPKCGPGGLT